MYLSDDHDPIDRSAIDSSPPPSCGEEGVPSGMGPDAAVDNCRLGGGRHPYVQTS